ncbi:hypothetical protein [Thiobacillus sp.]|nr:hypothetical protein [Thiobacillus sp.]MBC2731525.1 hypothetical protein [Thiobacillus sp.]MBC2740264.1 hypothetical protein [Thiobacillus sp.]MBC2761469.1 hypothetical protein [Thiobacillus sp.]
MPQHPICAQKALHRLRIRCVPIGADTRHTAEYRALRPDLARDSTRRT